MSPDKPRTAQDDRYPGPPQAPAAGPDAEDAAWTDDPEDAARQFTEYFTGEMPRITDPVQIERERTVQADREQRRTRFFVAGLAGLVVLGLLAFVVWRLTDAGPLAERVTAGSTSDTCSSIAAAAPADTTVAVVDLSGSGMAADVVAQLTARGFTAAAGGTAPDDADASVPAEIVYGDAGAGQAVTLGTQIGVAAAMESDGRTGTDVTLVLGTGFTLLDEASAQAALDEATASSEACQG